jgi:hypothetical protein
VWEALGVTTTGETNAPATTFKFVPAQKDVITMSDYVLSGGSSKFANFTLRARAAKYYTAIPYDYWIVFFTEESSISFSISKDGVSAESVSVSTPDGWGVIQLNAAGLMSGVTSVLAISSSYSETLSIYVDASPITERTVLEFVGIAGGMEYLPFEGIRHHEQASLRNYFSTANKSRKPLLLNGVRRQKLATRYTDIPYAEYLAHLLYSEDVRVLLASYATPSPVTVITDSAVLSESELFVNNFEIEYQ